ncbi:MAG: efflux RND transporter periplasmic adaptor subunit [Planctomycetota bacterium]
MFTAASLERPEAPEPHDAHGVPVSAGQAALAHERSLIAKNKAGRPGSIRRSLFGAAYLLIGVAVWWWLTTHHFAGTEHSQPSALPPVAALTTEKEEIVVLPSSAQVAANIGLSTVERRPLRDHLTVPGRLDYDARHLLDYASPVDGIVSRVFVRIRQAVAAGDSLAEVSSPDVGLARDDVRKCEDTWAIEKKASQWADTIADNVTSLLKLLPDEPSIAVIDEQFKNQVLGAYREKIVSAYSRLLYVEKVNKSTQSLSQGGVLSGRIVEERLSNQEVAKANFAAACEESLFLTHQDSARAKASLEQADRRLQISKQHLRALVGSRTEGDASVAGSTGELPPDSPGEVYDISSLVMRTPFAGIVEDVFLVAGQRVRTGDKLFVVADTSTLWVRAQIHERQWTAVEVSDGQSVRVTVPGADVHQTTARINHVGATVEADSRSVPLIAELSNDDAHYKPGMFVWVDLPQGEIRDALSVPASAVMRHEGKAFVFVAEGNDRFRRQTIGIGVENGDYAEVVSGLTAGQDVVSKGAFVLKSELLLEGDEDLTKAAQPPGVASP